ncbi:ABC transporter substrate-binding protein [Intrasporangium sp.]|uniref:peptide ABC transporter substrate-binding protein n=1 Tax=Intrasporangium sp. TaxID=1925024 RepID=UPI002939841B|nr:ABC transporter substrate-binding protein [Intrasporangium sp.]MDV3220210.1 ABC transporter substrate-binding protein [Intrasporangium sp.]
MKQRTAKRPLIAALVVAGVALAGCSSSSAGDTSADANPTDQGAGWPETAEISLVPGKPGGTFRLGIVEPTAIDPYNAQESEGILVTQYLFSSLVKFEPDGTVAPAVAEKWESDASCATWTFTLKKGTTFHNGEEVTSESFKRGWERVAAKTAASDVAYHLAPIKGFTEMNGGKADSLSGVDATDPGVLKVSLAEPDCEFYLRTGHTVFSPVPSVAGAADNKQFNEQPIGNGPFMMDGPWQHDVGIKLKRFENYTVGPKAYLDAVEISITANGNQDEYDGFNNGSFDWARIPVPLLPQARAANESKGNWIRKNTNGMNFLLPMVTQKPLDSADARKAISMAIDRDAIIKGIFGGSQTAATSFVPPVFKDAFQEGVCTACTFDLAKAKELAAKAGLVPGTELKFQINTGGGHEEWSAAVKQQLEKNLGLKVDFSAVEFRDMLENQQQPGASGIFRLAWGADYPTPGNFLGPLLSTASIGAPADKPVIGDNRGRYSNKAFDDLLAKAQATSDAGARTTLYQQAEKLAIGDDLALIPLWNRTQNRLANSAKFTNLRMDFNENPDLSVISVK